MSRTLLICRTLHQDKYSFQVFASWVLSVSYIEIFQTCYKQSLHSIWMSFTIYLNSYLQIWRPVHFWRPAIVLRYTFCFDPYCQFLCTEHNSIWCEINRKNVSTIEIWFHSTVFRRDFYVWHINWVFWDDWINRKPYDYPVCTLSLLIDHFLKITKIKSWS